MNTATERDMKDRSHSRLGRDALETLASPMSFLFFNYGSIGLFTSVGKGTALPFASLMEVVPVPW